MLSMLRTCFRKPPMFMEIRILLTSDAIPTNTTGHTIIKLKTSYQILLNIIKYFFAKKKNEKK